MSGTKRILKTILIALIIITLSFIFLNSSRSVEDSMKDSESVGGAIAEIIPPKTEQGDFLQKHLRKMAHLIEYGALGVELSILVLFFTKRRPVYFLFSLGFGAGVALLDETIQIFSERGSSVTDIWIDIGGFALFSAITLLSVLLVKAARVINRICD